MFCFCSGSIDLAPKRQVQKKNSAMRRPRTRERRTTVETLTATMRMTMKVVLARESVSTRVSRRAKVPTLLQWIMP